MNVALYARVSTTDQECEVQLAELRAYCDRRAWSIVEEFIDTGWSGRRSDRPAHRRLMKAAGLRLFDGVLVWKLDRFGRSVLDLVENLEQLTSAGVRFIAISQAIDTDKSNPAARLMMHTLAAVSEFESELIRERVKSGIEHAKKVGTKSGKAFGRPKMVFRRDLVIEMRQQGVTLREIAKRMEISLGLVARVCSQIHSLESLPGDGVNGASVSS